MFCYYIVTGFVYLSEILQNMGKPKRGIRINYDNVPNDIADFITDTQAELKKKRRVVVSQSATLTYLLRPLLPIKKGE